MTYAEFLSRKRRVVPDFGVTADGLPAALYQWQADIVRWALRKGRAAIFADCGLGKTFMQVAWADALKVRTLMLAPLCVAEQTVGEAAKLGAAQPLSPRWLLDRHGGGLLCPPPIAPTPAAAGAPQV